MESVSNLKYVQVKANLYFDFFMLYVTFFKALQEDVDGKRLELSSIWVPTICWVFQWPYS